MTEFLPQYSAQAIIDLERAEKNLRGQRGYEFYREAVRQIGEMLRLCVHIVLPPNAEIYRGNGTDRAMPTQDEIDSFNGLPAPITSFEYAWTDRDSIEEGMLSAPKRITLVVDSKQTHPGEPPPGKIHCATIMSVIYDETAKMWAVEPYQLIVAMPLFVRKITEGCGWAVRCSVNSLVDGGTFGEEKANRFLSETYSDLTAAVQCCHALRAGAFLEERTETSATRRWKFDKRGVGGLTYHILKLPRHVEGVGNGGTHTHASPRLHIRRAHIRKLPTGVLTFVRQCFVGNAEFGIVEKHYEVGRRRA